MLSKETMSADTLQPHTSDFSGSGPVKPPRQLLPGIFAFPPNRDTLGATSYFIVEKEGNILIDAPAWNETTRIFLQSQGGVKWMFLTHRGGMGQKVAQIQQFFHCEPIVQEQEAYLLPKSQVTTFGREVTFGNGFLGIWTPGFSPGSACLYYPDRGGVLFSGRHLLPNQKGEVTPLRTQKTFHWRRQLRSVAMLRDRFGEDNLYYILPGANTGFLRGRGLVLEAAKHLHQLNLEALEQAPAFW